MALATLSLTVEAGITGQVTKAQDLGDAKADYASKQSTRYTLGSTSGMANQVFQDQRTLSATSEELDLSGVLMNKLGETITFTKIRSILIRNLATQTGRVLSVGGAAANALAGLFAATNDIIRIGPGGAFLIDSPVDGITVTGGTGDLLKIDAGSNTITYDITIVGVA